jgi:Domain of unknown function (DUF397)
MMTPDFCSAQWRKSSHSSSTVDSMCVELANLDAIVGVRDGKNPSGPVLVFGRHEIRALLKAAKAGELNI